MMPKKSNSLEGFMKEFCPNCGSENLKIVEGSFPITYECKKCKYVFLKIEKEDIGL